MAALAWLAGCGELRNEPLLTAQVTGSVEGDHATDAYVFVLGQPQLRAPVDAQGHFVLKGLPAGSIELYLYATPERAARKTTFLKAGSSTDLGIVPAAAAGMAQVKVSTPGHQAITEGSLMIQGTPFASPMVATGTSLGPLAAGCYALQAELPGFAQKGAQICVGPAQTAQVPLAFDAASVQQGCARSGCEMPLTCQTSGACSECDADSSSCGAGLTCVNGRCEGHVLTCDSCAGDWQCEDLDGDGDPGHCLTLSDGKPACVEACQAGDCETHGFICNVQDLCEPNPAQMNACTGYQAVGHACTQDPECVALGLPLGICEDQTCTFICSDDTDCPEGASCVTDDARRICRRH